MFVLRVAQVNSMVILAMPRVSMGIERRIPVCTYRDHLQARALCYILNVLTQTTENKMKICSIESNDGEIIAVSEADFTEVDDHANESGAANWVWQFTDNPEEAVANHVAKQEEWEKDPSKEAY